MPDRPNILWICTDQQRYDTLGCYGNDLVETQTIDTLASRGVQFDRAFSQSPVCSPSRASFLTGRYPRTTRVRQNGQAIPEDERLVTKELSDAGYACGLAGKLHLSPCHPNDPDQPHSERRINDGYDEFHWSHDTGSGWPTNEYLQWLHREGIEKPTETREDCEYVHHSVPAEYQQTTWCVNHAIDFVHANESRNHPWLYSVNIYDPHIAFDPPEAYLERYLDRLEDIPLPSYEPGELDTKPRYHKRDHKNALSPAQREGYYPFASMDERDHRIIRAAYFAMIDLIDDQVGRLLAALEETNQLEDTLIIFMSDHGEMLGDNGIYLKGPYLYDQAIQVPLIMSWPGRIESGVTCDGLVELVDLAPTVLEAVGLDRMPGMQGKSLWPILTGESSGAQHRDDVYAEFYDAKPGHPDPKPHATMVRTDEHKLVQYHGIPDGELYDLTEDPNESVNRWDDPEYAETHTELLLRLTDRMWETCDPLPVRKVPW